MHHHFGWLFISPEMHRRSPVPQHSRKTHYEELVKYPSVHLTSIHEWDPSVLDFSYPEGDGEPVWACDPQHLDLLDPNFDHHGVYTKRAINTLSSLADVQPTSSMAILHQNHPFRPVSTKSSQKH